MEMMATATAAGIGDFLSSSIMYPLDALKTRIQSGAPYKWLDIYGEESMRAYMHKARFDMAPHVFATAEETYRTILSEENNKCVIISGESGACKTEASKQIQRVSGSGAGVYKVKRTFLESNPLLEAFGNAKTLRNNNSSRFVKYFELLFDSSGRQQGGKVTNYLLEKSLVDGKPIGTLTNLGIGYLSELYHLPLTIPMELVSTRIQTDSESDKFFQIMRSIVNKSGVEGLYKGLLDYFVLCLQPEIQYTYSNVLKTCICTSSNKLPIYLARLWLDLAFIITMGFCTRSHRAVHCNTYFLPLHSRQGADTSQPEEEAEYHEGYGIP
ncbi:hypothetical protein PsorP6_013748 [Peronosclerospora sorghi]|uniref:Uncharacterized protein n=1 Tax=Peronosclerospora sorghi TaxID=230839 RepID=A0ACC0VH29_9STRA|nr:hypothetical protein PsorP6_013748 [Peronosclerospora sorghi]